MFNDDIYFSTKTSSWFVFLCPVALHTALNRFMPIFQIALILRAIILHKSPQNIIARKIKMPAENYADLFFMF